MADSYLNWIASLNQLANVDGEEWINEPFVHTRPFGSRLNLFPNEFGNLHPLAKLYQNVPVYGMGPLSDDQKNEIIRRYNAFGPGGPEAANHQDEAHPNNNE